MMRPCLSETLTLPCTFAEDVANFADVGCPAMEVWLTKLEQHLQQHAVADTRKLLQDRGMTLAAAAYQGGLLLSQGEQRRAHYDHFRQRLELCQQFGIPVLIILADFVGPVQQLDLERALVSLQQAAQWAAGFDVTLALEFRAQNTFCASLDTALALVTQAGEPNLGVNLDAFHYCTGPSKTEDLQLLTRETLAHVQICDVSGVPRELATDSDRILPGDGDYPLQALLNRLREIDYQGHVALELFNPTLWQAKPTQVAEIAITALRRWLGLASL